MAINVTDIITRTLLVEVGLVESISKLRLKLSVLLRKITFRLFKVHLHAFIFPHVTCYEKPRARIHTPIHTRARARVHEYLFSRTTLPPEFVHQPWYRRWNYPERVHDTYTAMDTDSETYLYKMKIDCNDKSRFSLGVILK